MNYFRALLIGGLATLSPLRAVYAPIPEQEQGKELTISVRTGISHDTNLFGTPTDEISSSLFELAPRITYNASLTDQTFFSGSYAPTLHYFDNRPGDKLLDSHDLMLRVAHAFSKSTTIDLVDSFMISRNPESLLTGLPPNPDGTPQINPDQSFTRNQIDGRFNTAATPKIGVTIKARSVLYKYRNAVLGRSLDRIENLVGIAGDYAVLPETKAVVEYRHQDVFYRKLGETKNKNSDFVMAGFDHQVAKKLSLSGRFGAEWRQRAAEEDTTAPYAELSGKYDYTERSFLTAGYGYSLDETSDVSRFTDTQVHRFFANVQHAVTALIVASGSIAYEPAELKARRGNTDAEETTTRFGAALSYLPTKNWIFSASYDYDRVRSDIASREMERMRYGLTASYTF